MTIEALTEWMSHSTTVANVGVLCSHAGINRAHALAAPASGQRRAELMLHLQTLDLTCQRDVRRLLDLIGASITEIDDRLAAFRDKESGDVGRDETSQMEYRAAILLHLGRDGYEYADGRVRPKNAGADLTTIAAHAEAVDAQYLQEQVARLQAAVEDDPWLAIGTAKELVETVCKTILHDRGVEAGKGWDVPQLVRAARKELELVPESVPDGHRAAKTITALLSNLGAIGQGLAELRNPFGTGHGAESRAKGLEPRHARLAVGAAATLATFLLETHNARSVMPAVGSGSHSVRGTEV